MTAPNTRSALLQDAHTLRLLLGEAHDHGSGCQLHELHHYGRAMDALDKLVAAAEAADRMAAALWKIEANSECSIGLGVASKHGDTFCPFHIAREARLGR